MVIKLKFSILFWLMEKLKKNFFIQESTFFFFGPSSASYLYIYKMIILFYKQSIMNLLYCFDVHHRKLYPAFISLICSSLRMFHLLLCPRQGIPKRPSLLSPFVPSQCLFYCIAKSFSFFFPFSFSFFPKKKVIHSFTVCNSNLLILYSHKK